MLEINLRKSRQVKVKATPTRKGHTRKIPSKESQAETKIWKDWQQHYRQNLYTFSDEKSHEDMVATVIMISQSPQKAILKLTELQKKYPSSVGADLVKEFKRLYLKTRDDVIPGRKSPMSGWIQTERQMIKMLELNLQKLLQKDERGLRPGKVRYKRGGKTYIREQRVGQKETPADKKTSGRKGTGKIDKLPNHIKDEILNLRGNSKYSAPQIKDSLETTFNDDLLTGKISPNELRSLIRSGVVNKPHEMSRITIAGAGKMPASVDVIPDVDLTHQPYKLQLTGQGLTDWAKKHGVTGKTRKTLAQVEKETEEKWKGDWEQVINEKSKLEIKVNELHDELQATKKDIDNKNKLRDKLRRDLMACRAELGE